jgi:hypothetical protein
MAAFLSVLSSLLVGLLLVLVPWVNLDGVNLWESNYFLQMHPLLRTFVLDAFVRGAVTGLGLVNLLLAVLEALDHIRDLREGRRNA